MIKARLYQSSDAGALLSPYNNLQSGDRINRRQLIHCLENYERAGGIAWILEEAGEIHGYATLTPVPGLEGVYELEGGIVADKRRQGLGSYFLKHIIGDQKKGEVKQISCAVESTSSPVAHFLQKHDFQVEHSEWVMALDDLTQVKLVIVPDGYRFRRYPDSLAAARYRDLYKSSFLGLPWYQPYDNEAEVLADIADEDEILFLLEGDLPVGFIWLRRPEPGHTNIEPVGVIDSQQGRGLGRILLQIGLSKAAEQGAKKVTIGAWSENAIAIDLYKQLGFEHVRTITYLAFDTRAK